MRPQGRRELLTLQPPNEWRHPERPLIQFLAPYVFVADDPRYVVQTPPYLHYFLSRGLACRSADVSRSTSGPRPFSWAFEWYDISQPLVLKRGEPWFYVHFETENPPRACAWSRPSSRRNSKST